MPKKKYSVLLKEPMSGRHKSFSLRIPEELSETADQVAKLTNRSRNNIICACIRYCFNRMEVREGKFSEIRILEDSIVCDLDPLEPEPERQENQVEL